MDRLLKYYIAINSLIAIGDGHEGWRNAVANCSKLAERLNEKGSCKTASLIAWRIATEARSYK